MQLILKVRGPVAVEEAKAMIDRWQIEDAGYYGTPHGQRRIIHELISILCGFSESTIADPESPNRGNYSAMRWLTCGGNDHRIAILPDEVIIGYSGRRHGMRQEFREFLETYWGDTWEGGIESPRLYHTTEPGWMPWETRDSLGAWLAESETD